MDHKLFESSAFELMTEIKELVEEFDPECNHISLRILESKDGVSYQLRLYESDCEIEFSRFSRSV